MRFYTTAILFQASARQEEKHAKVVCGCCFSRLGDGHSQNKAALRAVLGVIERVWG